MIDFLIKLSLYMAGGFITLFTALKIEEVTYEEVKESEKTFTALYVGWPVLAAYIMLWTIFLVLIKPVATYIMSKTGGE